MELKLTLSFPILLLCVLISLKNQNADDSPFRNLQLEYYRASCPHAEQIIRLTVKELYQNNTSIAPAPLRLLYHDCFVQGCDASVLLDANANANSKMGSEKQSPPNVGLKGYDVVDTIKRHLEDTCPGIVSCADIIAVAARDDVVLDGGQFYPVLTGRRDRKKSFPSMPLAELPFPNSNLSDALKLFRSQHFDEGETTSLLGGGHSIGRIHCHFFKDRLDNFNGTGEADAAMDSEFVDQLRTKCSNTNNSSDTDPSIKMDYEGPELRWGHYTIVVSCKEEDCCLSINS